ncbi:hypothetical protein B0H67DRAFT_275248 [Lasiosphaeris hirsuta]|uniref:Uncharacterized protein n=1 Tax=Lasiosphaeris hirsuta TaxID=260670 RepID=A0AA40A897_9PEZI|nr:hypothetical protein B0H67DRAFT_275248 [Lasiosphaeris hirsuta]
MVLFYSPWEKPALHTPINMELPSTSKLTLPSPPPTFDTPRLTLSFRTHSTSPGIQQPAGKFCGSTLPSLFASPLGLLPDPARSRCTLSTRDLFAGDTLHIQLDQRLPPISHILGDVLSPNGQRRDSGRAMGAFPFSSSTASGLPTPLLTPTSPSSPGFPFYGNSPTFPARSQSMPSLAPLQSEPPASPLPSKSQDRGENLSPRLNSALTRHTRRRTNPNRIEESIKSCRRQEPYPKVEKKDKKKEKSKRQNTPYTENQEFFIRYHAVDLGLSWNDVQIEFVQWYPEGPQRSITGLNCGYYRANKKIPVLTADGLLVLADPSSSLPPLGVVITEKDCGERKDKNVCNDWWSDDEWIILGKLDEKKDEKDEHEKEKYFWWDYRGVRYLAVEIQVRTKKSKLRDAFPEDLVDERNKWVQPEHREETRMLAERRRLQREDWLARRKQWEARNPGRV